MSHYFGCDIAKANALLEEFANLHAVQAYLDWLVADYRPTRKSRSQMQSLLARKSPSKIQRMAIEAKRDCEISFWRVESVEVEESIDVECMLSGRRLTLQGQLLSVREVENHVLPLRVYELGNYHFATVAGPILTSIQADDALTYLELRGMTLSPLGMRTKPDLLGLLWDWMSASKPKPIIKNTDGESMKPSTAEFDVADSKSLARALDARADIEEIEPGSQWQWFAEPPSVIALGGRRSLGQLKLIGDKLELAVMSEERMKRARAWLEKIPGVVFRSVREPSKKQGDR
jgi:hypothetical protein